MSGREVWYMGRGLGCHIEIIEKCSLRLVFAMFTDKNQAWRRRSEKPKYLSNTNDHSLTRSKSIFTQQARAQRRF